MVVGLAHVKNLPHRLFDNWLYNTTVKQAFIELSFIPPTNPRLKPMLLMLIGLKLNFSSGYEPY